MPAEPTIDIESLLAPIPGDSPAGESFPFHVKTDLDEFRKEINPDDYDADDPTRPESYKPADWRSVARLTQETLKEKSKSLHCAAYLMEGLTKLHGFAGFRDGLRLFRRLFADCFDRIHPMIESEDDLELRAAPLNWLDEPDRGARFPISLRTVPIVFGPEGNFSYLDFRRSQEGKGTVTYDQFEKSMMATPNDKFELIASSVEECVQELMELSKLLNEKLKSYAPGLTGIRAAISEVRTLTQQILGKKGGSSSGSNGEAEQGDAVGDAGGAGAGGSKITSRQEVYRQLGRCADVLQQLEPHSPVPYLVRKAVEFGALPFPLLIKQLVRDATALDVINRELGIKEEGASASAS